MPVRIAQPGHTSYPLTFRPTRATGKHKPAFRSLSDLDERIGDLRELRLRTKNARVGGVRTAGLLKLWDPVQC